MPLKEPQPITYSYAVIGNPEDVKKAIEGINKSLNKYIIVQEDFEHLPTEVFNKYLEAKASIKKMTGTEFYSDSKKMTYLGKQ